MAGSSPAPDILSRDIRRPCKRASKAIRREDCRDVRVATPRMVALSAEQEREAAALLGRLLLDAGSKQAGSVFDGALGGVCPGAFGDATSAAGGPEKPHGSRGSGQ